MNTRKAGKGYISILYFILYTVWIFVHRFSLDEIHGCWVTIK